ncbi:hypothetical protein ABPG75_004083 [Micractinium tetrahymenae]
MSSAAGPVARTLPGGAPRPYPQRAWMLGTALSIALSLAAGGVLPRPLGRDVSLAVCAAGAAAFVAASLYFIGAKQEMRKAGGGSAFDTPVARLVTSGPFQYTRNPIYVAALCLNCALAALLNSAWPLLAALPWAAYVHLAVIPKEEALLARLFPREWQRYSAEVPRWLFRLRHRLSR